MLDEEILESILNVDENENFPLGNDKISESDTRRQINDRNSETKELDTSSVYSEPQQKDVLIASSRSNLPITEAGDDVPSLLKDNNFFPREERDEEKKPELEKDTVVGNSHLDTDSIIEEDPSKLLLSQREEIMPESKVQLTPLSQDNVEIPVEVSKSPSGIATSDMLNLKEPEEPSARKLSITDILDGDLTGD